jgi:hypothetical protein
MPARCTVGSASALVDIVSPIPSMSTQGEMHQPQAGTRTQPPLRPRRARPVFRENLSPTTPGPHVFSPL